MADEFLDVVELLEDGWEVRWGRTGRQFPPNNRLVQLQYGDRLKELYLPEDDYNVLVDTVGWQDGRGGEDPTPEVSIEKFVKWAAECGLGERQAEAVYRRSPRGAGQSRTEAAEAMDCTKSNVDNLERGGYARIIKAQNLVSLVEMIGVERGDPDGTTIGTCAICDEPTNTLEPHPEDDDKEMGDKRMICPECSEVRQG